ncbi:MAG: sigma-70 family RNA polymerase sigma factor [Archangium sp.]|nr:sigma-70 family RNA polymerase sigma factor [Archangium sp.]MDP3571214.1 sigma-70 family RNA polymerase sigma factor [Archangium sp.]
MVRAHLGLVHALASKYAHRGLDKSDLLQEGSIGLMRAVERFDHRRGYRFSTCARWWIRQAITSAIADHGRTVRVPVHLNEQVLHFWRVSNRLAQKLGRAPASAIGRSNRRRSNGCSCAGGPCSSTPSWPEPGYTGPMNWIGLALATAIAFGAYNIFIKLGAGKIDHVLGAVVLQVVAAILGATYAVMLKVGGRTLEVTRTGVLYAVLAGIAVGLAEILTFLVFARGAPASLATPIIMGGSILLTSVLGIAVLRERLGLPQALGIVLIALGIALVSRGVPVQTS